MGIEELRAEYEQLLVQNGLSVSAAPDAEFTRKLEEELQELWRQEGRSEEEIGELTANLIASRFTGMASTIKELVDDVEADMKLLGATLDQPVFVGEYPTGELCAEIRAHRGGCIVLLNNGLFMTMHLILKTMARAWNFMDFKVNVFTPLLPMAISQAEVTNELLEILAAYFKGDPRLASRKPLVTGHRQIMLSRTTFAAEKFVLAHEYAHLLQGHVGEGAETRVLDNSVGRIGVVSRDHQKEYDADIMAVSFLMASADWSEKKLDSQYRLTGPFIFFGVHDMILRVGDALYKRPMRYSLTHPPSHDRIEHLRKFCIQKYGEELMKLADDYSAWLKAYADFIVTEFQKGTIMFPEGSPYRVNPI